jgi:hypothetical protein
VPPDLAAHEFDEPRGAGEAHPQPSTGLAATEEGIEEVATFGRSNPTTVVMDRPQERVSVTG